jgi:4,5-dihydroxyphthalate decarboxylase
MSKLRLNMALRYYDRTAALIDGTVQPEGIDLNYVQLKPWETFWRVLHHSEFDVTEISTSGYVTTLERNPKPYIAIPVFPSKVFRHADIYINTRSGIQEAKDLEGKKVGGPEYSQTAAVWARGILQDEYGVDLTKVLWYRGGIEAPDPVERVELNLPPKIHLQEIPPGKTINGMLEAGELDAMITSLAPSSFLNGSPNVRRLFPNYREVEMAYYGKTGIFPIMHTIAIKREIYDKNQWIAASLMKAFEDAKRHCYQNLGDPSVYQTSLPWLHWHLEENFRFFGKDPFAYGVEANRSALETLARYIYEQGLTREKADVDVMFAKEAADMFRASSRAGDLGVLRYFRQRT